MENLDELKKKYNELGEEIKRLENKEKIKRWRANHEKDYYYIDEDGTINSIYEDNDICDNYHYKVRNYFKTKEEAQRHLENINTYYDLMDLAEELNNGEKIDWNNDEQEKYYISYDDNINELYTDYTTHYISLGNIYCLDKNFFDKAYEKIGPMKLERLFF